MPEECRAVLVPFSGVLFVRSKQECKEWLLCNANTTHATCQAINEPLTDAPSSILQSDEGVSPNDGSTCLVVFWLLCRQIIVPLVPRGFSYCGILSWFSKALKEKCGIM